MAMLDTALELETTLKVLLSNVLTSDTRSHRKEVADVLERAKAGLPEIIASTESLSERIRQSHDTKQLDELEPSLRAQRARARGLAEMIAHGIDRGKILDDGVVGD